MSKKSDLGRDNLLKSIDHIAVAVQDLEKALEFYLSIPGLSFVEERETFGAHSGMKSAVLTAGSFSIVLVQGTNESSQVTRFVNQYGAGVQHVAFSVNDIDQGIREFEMKGVVFATTKIIGDGLKQVFTRRDKNSGMMFELIERTDEKGFQDQNVQNLFDQLEQKNEF